MGDFVGVRPLIEELKARNPDKEEHNTLIKQYEKELMKK